MHFYFIRSIRDSFLSAFFSPKTFSSVVLDFFESKTKTKKIKRGFLNFSHKINLKNSVEKSIKSKWKVIHVRSLEWNRMFDKSSRQPSSIGPMFIWRVCWSLVEFLRRQIGKLFSQNWLRLKKKKSSIIKYLSYKLNL